MKREKKQLAKFMRRLCNSGLTTSSGGNISYKDQNGNIYISASQTDKANIKWTDIAIVDISGKNMSPELKPSMEISMHLEIYKSRPDINAIIHAHPLYTGIFAVTDHEINTGMTGESRYILGEIASIPYELMGTNKLANSCAEKLKNTDVAIMKNHGAICIGKNLYEAFDKMEVLEFTAKTYYKTLMIGNCSFLSCEQLQEIDKLKE